MIHLLPPRTPTPGPPSRRAIALDAVLGLAAFALSVGFLSSGRFTVPDIDPRDLDALGVVLAALTALPLAVRRFAPMTVMIASTATTALLYGLGYPLGPPAGSVFAMHWASASRGEGRRGERLRLPVAAVLLLGVLAAHMIARDGFPSAEILLGVMVWSGAWIVGDLTVARRRRIAQLEERALRAEREAERERRLAAARERTRIARDLHDSAGHAINVILVQVGAARLLQDKDPERAKQLLEGVEEVARETIGDIDRMVRVLRDDDDGAGVEPAPGLAALEALAERHRAAGMEVDLVVRGPRRPLAPSVDQAAYRILQEALTNAALHGRGRAEVEVAFEGDAVEIEVENPAGASSPAPVRDGGGHGIVGMRERAALLGGDLEAGAAGGVFRVHARLPAGAGERAVAER